MKSPPRRPPRRGNKSQYSSNYHQLHKDEINARSRRNYDKNRERDKANATERYYVNTHGITRNEVGQLLLGQSNKCAICAKTIFMGGKAGAHYDHDHLTNKYRGILCNNCNLMLGHANDDITILFNAINYLRSFII